jgi:hypothetical protein
VRNTSHEVVGGPINGTAVQVRENFCSGTERAP